MAIFKAEMQKLTETEYKFFIEGGTNLRAENSIGTNIPIINGWNEVTSDTKLIIESDDLTTEFSLSKTEGGDNDDDSYLSDTATSTSTITSSSTSTTTTIYHYYSRDENLNKLILHNIGNMTDFRFLVFESPIVEFICHADTSQITDMSYAWSGCNNLTSFPLIDTSNVTKMNHTWFRCNSLTSFPLIDTSNVTEMEGTWSYNNKNLTSFPLIDTSSVINMSGTWEYCYNLTTFPLIDTSSVIDISNAWSSCESLTSFPLIDTSNVTIMSNAWYNNSNLTSFPLIDTSSVINMSSTWEYCINLTSFPLIDTSSVIDISNAWNYNNKLTSFPLMDTSNVVKMKYTWNNCSNLTSFPLIDTSSVVKMEFTWNNCSNLTSFPLIDTSNVTDMKYTWRNCTSLKCITRVDTTSTIEITEIFDNTSSLIRPTAEEQAIIMDIGSGGYNWINDLECPFLNKYNLDRDIPPSEFPLVGLNRKDFFIIDKIEDKYIYLSDGRTLSYFDYQDTMILLPKSYLNNIRYFETGETINYTPKIGSNSDIERKEILLNHPDVDMKYEMNLILYKNTGKYIISKYSKDDSIRKVNRYNTNLGNINPISSLLEDAYTNNTLRQIGILDGSENVVIYDLIHILKDGPTAV